MRDPLMDPHAGWWKTFFSGLAVEAQRSFYPPEATRMEAEFIQKTLRLPPGAAVLDVPCGDGRIAVELASRGLALTGVDFAGPSLEHARRGARDRGVEAEFEEGDMGELPWSGRFDAAFCFGNSFGYQDDEGNLRFLKGVGRALKPGGKFLLHYPLVAEVIHLHLLRSSWHRFGDMLMLRSARHDHRRGRVYTQYIFTRGRDSEDKTASYRVYTFFELSSMLREAGFGELSEFGSMAGEPFHLGSKDHYVLATRS